MPRIGISSLKISGSYGRAVKLYTLFPPPLIMIALEERTVLEKEKK